MTRANAWRTRGDPGGMSDRGLPPSPRLMNSHTYSIWNTPDTLFSPTVLKLSGTFGRGYTHLRSGTL